MKKYAWMRFVFLNVMMVIISPMLAVVSSSIRLGPRAAVPEARRFMMQLQYKMKDPKANISKEEEADLEQAFRVLGRSGMVQYNAIKKELTRRKSIVPIRVEEVKKEKPIENQVIEVKQKPKPSEVLFEQTPEFKAERATEEKGRKKKIYDACGKKIITEINKSLKSFISKVHEQKVHEQYENALSTLLKESITIGNTRGLLSAWLISYECNLGDGNGSQKLSMKTDDDEYIKNINQLLVTLQSYLNSIPNEETTDQDLPIRLNKGLENIHTFIAPIDSQEEKEKIEKRIQTIKQDVEKRVKDLQQIAKTKEAQEEEVKAKELGEKVRKSVVDKINNLVSNNYTADGILTQDLSIDGTKKKIQEWLGGYRYNNKSYKLIVDQTYDEAIDNLINGMKRHFSDYVLKGVYAVGDYRSEQGKQLKALKTFIDSTSDSFKKSFQTVAGEINNIVTNKISAVEAEHKKEEQKNVQQATKHEMQRGKNYNATAIKVVTDNIKKQLKDKKKATEILAVSCDVGGPTKTIQQWIENGYQYGENIYPLIGDGNYASEVVKLGNNLKTYVSNKEEVKKINSQQVFNNELKALDVFITIIPDSMKTNVLKVRNDIEQIIKKQSEEEGKNTSNLLPITTNKNDNTKTPSLTVSEGSNESVIKKSESKGKEVKAKKIFKMEEMFNQQQKEQAALQQPKKTKEALPFNTNNAFVNTLKSYASKDIENESPITYVNNLMNAKLNANQTVKEILGLYSVTLSNENFKYVSAIIKKVYDKIVFVVASENPLPAWAKDPKIVTTLGEAIDNLRMLADLGSDTEQNNDSILNNSVSLAKDIVEKQKEENK